MYNAPTLLYVIHYKICMLCGGLLWFGFSRLYAYPSGCVGEELRNIWKIYHYQLITYQHSAGNIHIIYKIYMIYIMSIAFLFPDIYSNQEISVGCKFSTKT